MNNAIIPANTISDQTRVRAPWYQPPQLMVMTAFIVNTTDGIWGKDFIVAGDWTPEKQQHAMTAWRRGLGRDYDPDAAVRTFKDAGASGVIFYDKWHDGLVCHDTALTGFKTERNFLGETVAALRRHAMRIVVYYSLGLDYNPEFWGRDWVCTDGQGQPIGLAFPADWQSFHSPYRHYAIDQLVEVVRNHGPIDGVWLDIVGQPSRFYQRAYGWTGPSVSSDRYTRAAFEAACGKPLEDATPDEIEAFDTSTLDGILHDIRSALAAIQPDICLSWNGAGRHDIAHPQKARWLDAPMDWFSMEGHLWPHINRSARISQAVDRPVEVGMLLSSSWYTPMDDQAPPPAMSEPDALVAAATAWIHGLNVYAAMTPGHSGRYDPAGDVQRLRVIGHWLQAHAPSLTGTQPYADVGILAGTPAPDVSALPAPHQLWPSSHRLLSDLPPCGELGTQPGLDYDERFQEFGYDIERIGSLFAGYDWNLADYRLLLLPENALLDDLALEAIRLYVQQGGRLLACGHASCFDAQGRRRPEFALADVFGVSYAGPLPGYKQWARTPVCDLVTGLPLNPGALGVTATTGTVLAIWRSAGETPALVEHAYGQGRCLYVSAEERVVVQTPAFLRELAARLIGPPPIAIRSARAYAHITRRVGQDVLLSLLCRDPAGPGPEPLEILLNTALLGAIADIAMVPSGDPIPLHHDPPGLRFTIRDATGVAVVRLRRAAG